MNCKDLMQPSYNTVKTLMQIKRLYPAVLMSLLSACGGEVSTYSEAERNAARQVIVEEFSDEATTAPQPMNPETLAQLPRIQLSSQQFADANVVVMLDAQAQAATEEHRIENTLWRQLSGPPVDTLSPSLNNNLFIAPDVEQETPLVFQFAVRDSAGRINAATSIVTVRPSDALVRVVGGLVAENDGFAEFAVKLLRTQEQAVRVRYFTQGETATAGEDFISTRGELTFAPGELTKTVTVPLLQDFNNEDYEVFTLQVNAAIDSSAESNNAAVAIIRNVALPTPEPTATPTPIPGVTPTPTATPAPATPTPTPIPTAVPSSGPSQQAPAFTSVGSVSVDENISGLIYTATASDANGDPLVFSLSGADAAAFSLDASSGALSLLNAADFEAPADANADGVYDITLSVDDGNNGSDQLALSITVNDVTQLALQVSYPPPGGNLGGGVSFTSVAGLLEDREDGEVLASDIDAVRVNGQTAEIQFPDATGNPVRWRTRVPVTTVPNNNTLEIALADSSGNTQQVVQRLSNRPIMPAPIAVTLDPANNRALVFDGTLDTLVAIDLISGDRRTLSGANVGAGPQFSFPRSIALDSTNNRVLITDSGLDALMAINLASGDREILSNNNTGAGPQLIAPAGIALDSLNNRALIVDSNIDAVMGIDLDTGDREILSNDNTGEGPLFNTPEDIALDTANNRALIADLGLNAVVAIDLDTGGRSLLSNQFTFLSGTIALDNINNRALVVDVGLEALVAINLDSGEASILSSSDNTGLGLDELRQPDSLALDSDNNRVLVVSDSFDALVGINLSNGERSILSTGRTGSGPELADPSAITLDSDKNRALITDEFLNALVAINLDSGDRNVISGANTGAGTRLESPNGQALDAINNRTLIVDIVLDALVAINLENGNRETLSDGNIGVGPVLNAPIDIALDGVNNRALVVDRIDELATQLLAIDLDSGERNILVGSDTGAGPGLSSPRGIALDSASNRALIIDSFLDALVAIDLNSGDRSILSDDDIGAGPALSFPTGIALDRDNDRALIADGSLAALVAIDLDSGERSILSDTNTGSGPILNDPIDIILDTTNNRVLLLERNQDLFTTLSIDLATGERAIASQNSATNLPR